MPSPIGHALGGIAAASLVAGRPSARMLCIFAVVGALPDVDFLLPLQHRGPSHSLGTAVAAAALALVVVAAARPAAPHARLAIAVGLAYASHTLLDWLGTDTWDPRGLMALWPLSSAYFVSGLDVFRAVNRQYWKEGFWSGNLLAVLQELAILLPVLFVVWRRRSRHEAPQEYG